LPPPRHPRGKPSPPRAPPPGAPPVPPAPAPVHPPPGKAPPPLPPPRHIPKGTRIDCLAHFDNSSKNPANPDPSRKVVFGEQTFEEMMIGYIDVAFLDRTPEVPDRPVAPLPGAHSAP